MSGKKKVTVTIRKPPPPVTAEDVLEKFVAIGKESGPKGQKSGSSGVQRSRSPNVYLPERKRGWLQGEAPRRCTLYLPQGLFSELRERCFRDEVELSAFVTEAVRAALVKK